MNLGEMKQRALSLMAEYSIDGVEISPSENADYLNRMNRFANDAQMEISDKVGIDEVFTYTQVGVSAEGFNKVDLPTDFKELRFVNLNDYRFEGFRIENSKILIPKSLDGTFDVSYYKNPTEITKDTLDTYDFEVDQHTQTLIPYFVSGMCLNDENPNLADRLLNMYYSRLGSVTKKNYEYPNIILSTYTV